MYLGNNQNTINRKTQENKRATMVKLKLVSKLEEQKCGQCNVIKALSINNCCPRCIEEYEDEDGNMCKGERKESSCSCCGVCEDCECLYECEKRYNY